MAEVRLGKRTERDDSGSRGPEWVQTWGRDSPGDEGGLNVTRVSREEERRASQESGGSHQESEESERGRPRTRGGRGDGGVVRLRSFHGKKYRKKPDKSSKEFAKMVNDIRKEAYGEDDIKGEKLTESIIEDVKTKGIHPKGFENIGENAQELDPQSLVSDDDGTEYKRRPAETPKRFARTINDMRRLKYGDNIRELTKGDVKRAFETGRHPEGFEYRAKNAQTLSGQGVELESDGEGWYQQGDNETDPRFANRINQERADKYPEDHEQHKYIIRETLTSKDIKDAKNNGDHPRGFTYWGDNAKTTTERVKLCNKYKDLFVQRLGEKDDFFMYRVNLEQEEKRGKGNYTKLKNAGMEIARNGHHPAGFVNMADDAEALPARMNLRSDWDETVYKQKFLESDKEFRKRVNDDQNEKGIRERTKLTEQGIASAREDGTHPEGFTYLGRNVSGDESEEEYEGGDELGSENEDE